MRSNGLSAQIKEMEAKKRDEAVSTIPENKEPEKVDFDTWYHIRSSSIPVNHLKEIILADFKARKLSKKETMEAYDEALRVYGINI